MNEITCRANAKVNLALEVVGRRGDGYHLVRMVMQSLALHDLVRVRVDQDAETRLSLCSDCPELPSDARNLAYRAAETFYTETGVRQGACDIRIRKRIPLAAGLGGGSADAAAVLRALDTLHATELSDDDLCRLGLRIGADVPFCLLGGTRLAEGIGEILSPLPPMPHSFLVLCRPPIAVSTPEVYRAFDSCVEPPHPDTNGMCCALAAGDYSGVCQRLSNMLEVVTVERHPEIQSLKRTLSGCGADGVLMTGSGPTVFALFVDRRRAEAAANALRFRCPDTILTETTATAVETLKSATVLESR